MKLTPTLLALAVATCLSVPAQAETAADDARDFDPIEVKGERSERASANQNVTVLDADDIENEMAQGMEDLIRYIPGISIVDLGRFGDNGFNIRGLEGDRVAISVDGLSLAESLETTAAYEFFRAGRGGIDTDALKRVEVIKGADAISAGSGALGGAVVFTTKDPADYLKAEGNDTHLGLKYGYTGARDENMGTLTLANRTGIVESMLVFTRRDGHEAESWYDTTVERSGTGRRTPDPIDSQSDHLLAKLDIVPNQAHRFGLVWERSRAENRVENLSRVYAPGYLERWGDDSNDRDRYGLRYVWKAGNTAFDEMQAQVDRQQTDSRALTTILAGSGCPGVTTPCLRSENRATEQTLDRVAVDFSKDFAGAHALIYGAAWQRREVDFTAVDTRWRNDGSVASVTVDPSQVPRTDVDAWNLYLRDRVSLLDGRLTVTAGARYDRYDYSPDFGPTFDDDTGTMRDVSFSAPTWQAGASFEFVPDHSLWAQLGRGFRAPTVGNLYAPTSTSTVTEVATGNEVTVWSSVANPNLEAEKSLNAEVGYRWQTDRMQLGVSLFRDKYDNFIESAQFVQNPDVEYQVCGFSGCSTSFGTTYTMPANYGEVTVKGAELEGRWLLGEAWQLRLAYSHAEGEKKNGDPLESISPDRGVLGLQYLAPQGRWSITGNLTHALAKKMKDAQLSETGDFFQTTTPDFLSDAYTVFDLFGSYTFNDNLRVSAGVYNLFDERYYLWSRIRLVNEGANTLYGYVTGEGIGRYSEPGRNLRLTVSYRF
ncbi:TonB-dependent hemoglobin/transferrin/lactoferrin family receptor [Pseudoxanthomonas wuyuanensis]